MRRYSTVWFIAVLAMIASCGTHKTDLAQIGEKDTGSSGVERPPAATLESFEPVDPSVVEAMEIAASDGSPETESVGALSRPATRPLSKSALETILGRLSPLKSEKDDRQDFAKRENSLPPPKTGQTITDTFPPAVQKDRPDAVEVKVGPLKVLRRAPEGEVPVSPSLSVTFDQPMVEVTSHAETIAAGVPVKLDPLPEGQWRWIGAKTLLFEPATVHMPMATEYTVTIPKDTASKVGGKLAEDVTFTFSTPPVTLQSYYPNQYEPMRLNQAIFLGFDQKIRPADMIEHIIVRAGDQVIPMRLADPATIEKDATIKAMVAGAQPDRYMVVQPTRDYPYNSSIHVAVTKGAPSAEGPRKTAGDQSYYFQTYGPLAVVNHRCGWGECDPRSPFSFQLTNPLDDEAFDESLVEVSPEFPAMTINQYGQHLSVDGQKPGRRTYTVTLKAGLKDVFGQTLGKDQSFTFDVGAAEPSLTAASGEFIVLDPKSGPQFTFYTTNYDAVRVKAWSVQPSDWLAYREYLEDWRYYGKKAKLPPGRKVIDTEVKIAAKPDELTQTNLDLKEAFGKSGLGHTVIELKPSRASKGSTMPVTDYIPVVRSWLNATKLGVDVLHDYETAVVWASDLATGEPAPGVEVRLHPSDAKGTTGPDGTAEVPLGSYVDGPAYVLARRGDDEAMIPERYSNGLYKSDPGNTLAWFVFDDRAMYKPGEEVHVKGWVRNVDQRKGGDVSLAAGAKEIRWTAYDAFNNKITEGKSTTSALGGFDLGFKLPGTPNLGHARLELSAIGASAGNTTFYHTFQIQEFRTPEFEVRVNIPPGPFYAQADASARLEAKYYAGGALPGAEVNWNVTATAASFTPPNQQKYTFGTWIPWWRMNNQPGQSAFTSLSAKTDAAGDHFLNLSFGAVEPPRPMSVRLQGTVMDVNRQAWTGTGTMLVHPSEFYVGLRSERYFVERGQPLEVFAIVSDVDGKLTTARPVKIRAGRIKYSWRNGRYDEEVVDEQACDFVTGTTEHKCTFETKEGGTYRISATTTDDYGRLNYTEITRWVSGGKQPVARTVTMENVDLIPDRDSYRPGETAEILVRTPIVPAEAVLSIRRNGLVEQRRFTMQESTTVINVPIKAGHVPNLWVSVDLVGQAPRLDAKGEVDTILPTRPAIASGDINLPVPPLDRTLEVTVVPAAERTEPGANTSVSVEVKDHTGKPAANAEVAIVVVDEAILALSAYQMADPVSLFYTTRAAGVSEKHSRLSVELIDPNQFGAEASSTTVKRRSTSGRGGGGGDKKKMAKPSMKAESKEMALDRMAAAPAAAPAESMAEEMRADSAGMLNTADMAAAGDPNQAIAVRSNFNPLAAFVPAGRTDATGKIGVELKMPDNLTRYRVMAVAVHGDARFGHGESAVTARLPLMVRPSAPRFLNFGDKLELPIVVQNQTDEPMDVAVATRASNLVYTGATGLMVTVPANDRVEVRFPATTDEAGRARFQVGVSAGKWSDAAEIDLPVWTPATSEAFATYGQIDDGAVVQPVKMPGEVWTQFGGLEVTTSSTAMQSLTDAFLYLYEYEYECAEQISSRMISVAALRDVLTAFKAEGMPTPKVVSASMQRDIDELQDRQNWDGGFGLWRKGQPSWPYVSLHAAHALTRAKAKGYKVSDESLRRMDAYLANIENYIPYYYSEYTRLHIIAYALYVRGLNKNYDLAKAREVMRRGGKLEKLSFESVGWLLGVFTNGDKKAPELEEIRRFLNNRVTETAGAAHWASAVEDGSYLILHSDRRADGVILEALMDDDAKSDLIPKVVKGLMAHRTKGRWGNTQENAFVLLALDKYFNAYEKVTPDFVARVWLGDRYAGEHAFKGRTTEEHQIDIAMKYVGEADDQKLYIQKDGKGRMYYRIGMNYAPKSLWLDAADHGFVVERTYEGVDDPTDVKRRADGAWEVKAGAKVKVKLTMVAESRRYHVALVDPMPAGFESLNPALGVTEDIPQDQAINSGRSDAFSWWWWSRPWFEHQNMRDERTEAFTTLLWGGVHNYTYYARATTPGEFVVPPAKAEEMYSPETFGRSSSDRVFVVDK